MYNVGVTGVSAYYPVHFFVKSEPWRDQGRRAGRRSGAAGCMSPSLWVDESVRGKDWGTRLMDHAEAYAREHGCHSVTLDTHSFQARPFYEARGYEVFGMLDDFPKGHKRFFPEEEALEGMTRDSIGT